jgi:hypothetical protein
MGVMMARLKVLAAVFLALAAVLPAFAAADYVRLRQVQIIDQHGFGRPLQAASLLLPQDWQVESSVRWSGDTGCPENLVQLALRARSPDGRLAFEVFPNFVWKGSDDPAVIQSAQQAMLQTGMRGCDMLPPYDAADYLQHVFLPRWRAASALTDLGHVPELAQARLLENQALAGPMPPNLQVDFDVALAVLEAPRAGGVDEEWVLATVMRNALSMPSIGAMLGGYPQSATSYTMVAMSQFAARAPKGELEKHERLFEAIYRSFRVDPAWDAAVAQVLGNIAALQRKGIGDRARIMREASREIGDIIQQTHAARQASQDRSFERRIQSLRGVETWVDPATQARVELSSGYRDAWSNGAGDYVLADVPDFDPAAVLGGSWTRLTPDER